MKSNGKLPTTLGDLIDAAYDAREARDARKKILEADPEYLALNDRFKLLEEAVLGKLAEQRATLARGETARAYTTTEDVASVDSETGGWAAVWKWAKKNDAMDLFHKRLASKAVAERMAAMKGVKAIPGVKVVTIVRLNLRTVAGKQDE